MTLKTFIFSFGILEDNGDISIQRQICEFFQKITCVSVQVTESVV